MSNYKVLITTSGIGQRLGQLTKFTNKGLVRIGKKPALAYIIEAYPPETHFVITLGHFGEHIKEFLSLAYPNHTFEYVLVDPYEGPGSSLGYSMLQAKDKLQCPFVYHAVDTIIFEPVPNPSQNWIGVCVGEDASQYASWKVVADQKLIFNDKGAIDFDYIHIGLVGINDHVSFWSTLDNLYRANPQDHTLNDCKVIVAMLANNKPFSFVLFTQWYDCGNTTALHYAREKIFDHFDNLDKPEESVFLFKDFVIKFFFDETIVAQRSMRARTLTGLVPHLEGATKNFYRYTYVQGDLYSRIATPSDFTKFLVWAKEHLWLPVHEIDDLSFKKACDDFYFKKTETRVQAFLTANNLVDTNHSINGEAVPSISDMLCQIDTSWITNTQQKQFHGDLIVDNIIKTADGYCLIDWRHNFGGLLRAGDMYYDLAKLNHNLIINHELIKQNLFWVQTSRDGSVSCDILRKNNLVECQNVLFRFAAREGYDIKKINVLTGIIWLNMSPLHHHPFDIFLYYFGKLQLWRALNS